MRLDIYDSLPKTEEGPAGVRYISHVSRRSARGAFDRQRRLAAVAAIAVIVAGVAISSLDGPGPDPKPKPKTPRPFTVGSGAKSALVLPERGRQRRPVVVFLRGWGLIGPEAYRGWLRHLTGRGSTVIVPRYQASLRARPDAVPGDALAGVRSAVERLRPRPRTVVVVGHSVGAVLAVDYAVRTRALGLPAAQAVMSIFPGAALRDLPPVPQADPAQLPSTVRRLVVLESTRDEVVSTSVAEDVYHRATRLPEARRELVIIREPAAGDHFAPALDAPAARRVFWARLDRLLTSLS